MAEDDEYEVDYAGIAAEAHQRQIDAFRKHMLDEVRVYTFAGAVAVRAHGGSGFAS